MERVRDGERNAAIRAVEAALADGRIVAPDRDRRVDQIRSAQTPSELDMITHDLQHREAQPAQPAQPAQAEQAEQAAWPTYTPPEPSSAEPTPPPAVTYGRPQRTSSATTTHRLFGTRRSSGGIGCMLIPFVFFLFVGGTTLVSVIGAFVDADETGIGTFEEFEEFPEFEGEPAPTPPNLFRVAGFDELVAQVRAETGSTTVFRVVLYPAYASITVPAQARGQRELRYTYNGELGDPSKGRSTFERFDLDVVDPAVVPRVVRQARRTLVEEPSSVYVIIQKPDDVGSKDAWISVYASNDFSESGFLEATLDGTVVNRTVSQ